MCAHAVLMLWKRRRWPGSCQPAAERIACAARLSWATAWCLSSRDTGQVILSATAFTQYYDIDTSVSRRYKPYEQDGMLCIDLTGPSAEVRGNRAKRVEPADSEEPDAR